MNSLPLVVCGSSLHLTGHRFDGFRSSLAEEEHDEDRDRQRDETAGHADEDLLRGEGQRSQPQRLLILHLQQQNTWSAHEASTY